MQLLKLHMLLAFVVVAVDSMAVTIMENTATDGENSAVDGENNPVNGENSAVDGENNPVDGDNSADDGKKTTVVVQPSKTKRGSKEDKAFERQVKQLLKMRCKPRLTKVFVANEIGEADEKKDKDLFPQVVAVKRCDHNCSYCGDNAGREAKTCVAARTKIKNFTIRYYDDSQHRQYFKLPITEDTKCHCVH
nr:uncharacterized protein LOC123771620 [Procambarus clarkii]